jgi:proteasome lid subunit RPN8/RPN11
MLLIPKAELEAIRARGEQTYPHECCGVLVGKILADGKRQVELAIECANSRVDSPHNRFEIRPVEIVRIQRECRERDLEIVGFYHSHPDHAAMWSAVDLANAHWTGCSYVITGVNHGHAAETNSFVLAGDDERGKSFESEAIEIV